MIRTSILVAEHPTDPPPPPNAVEHIVDGTPWRFRRSITTFPMMFALPPGWATFNFCADDAQDIFQPASRCTELGRRTSPASTTDLASAHSQTPPQQGLDSTTLFVYRR